MNKTHVNKETTYSYDELSEIYTSTLPESIVNFYNANYSRIYKEVENFLIKNWEPRYSNCEPTLHNIVRYILWWAYERVESSIRITEYHNSRIEKDVLNAYAKKVVERKKYLYKCIDNEYRGINSKRRNNYLCTAWSVHQQWQLLNASNSEQLVQEEFYKQQYDRVKAWNKDKTAHIIDFPLISLLPTNQQVKDLVTNIIYVVFFQICKKNYENLYGFVTEMTELTLCGPENDYQIYNWIGGKFRLEDVYMEQSGNDVHILHSFGDNVSLLLAVVKNSSVNDCDIRSQYEDLLDSYNKKLGKLDADDYAIITNIQNRINYSVATQDIPIRINFVDLFESIYGPVKDYRHLRLYRPFLSKLMALSSKALFIKNIAGANIYKKDIVTFFELSYEFLSSNTSSSDVNEEHCLTPYSGSNRLIIDTDGSSIESDIALLSRDEFETLVLIIYPSHYLKEQWLRDSNIKISTTQYMEIESPNAKFIMFLLQKNRLMILPDTVWRMTMEYVSSEISFVKASEQRIKNEIETYLNYFKEHAIIIEQFNRTLYGFDIKFLPPTEYEKKIYKIC